MLFRKWGCLVGPENSIFRKLKSVDPKKMPLTTEIILHFYFPFKVFPENERERERARARVREEKKHSSQSDDRRRTPSSSPRRSHELQSDDCNPRSRSTARSLSSRDRDRWHDLAKRRSQSRIAVVGLELARSAWIGARSSPAIVGLTRMFLLLSRALSLSLSLSLSLIFRKYFKGKIEV